MEELGNLEKIGEALSIMGVNPDDFKDKHRSSLVSLVAEYLNIVPDPTFFVQRAVGNKQVDRLAFMAEYVDLHKKLDKVSREKESVENEIKHYEK